MRGIRLAGILLAVLALTVSVAPADAHRAVVGTDPANDFADDQDLGALAGPLGIDVLQLEIGATEGGVEFAIVLAALEVPPPNEVIRYLWQFQVDGVEFWVQAKMSDIASGTTFADDPEGALTHVQGAFRLRGDCQIIQVISTCVHLKWLDGVFDIENDEVRMTVPLDDPVAPHFTSGAVIDPDADGVTASIQVGISNASTSDSALQDGSFIIP